MSRAVTGLNVVTLQPHREQTCCDLPSHGIQKASASQATGRLLSSLRHSRLLKATTVSEGGAFRQRTQARIFVPSLGALSIGSHPVHSDFARAGARACAMARLKSRKTSAPARLVPVWGIVHASTLPRVPLRLPAPTSIQDARGPKKSLTRVTWQEYLKLGRQAGRQTAP